MKKLLLPLKDFGNWILKRKKNISLSFILIPILKVLTHFFLFPTQHEVVVDRIKNIQGTGIWWPGGYKNIYGQEPIDLGSHFEVMFTDRLDLFIPVIVVFLIVVWFFNDKIKAR